MKTPRFLTTTLLFHLGLTALSAQQNNFLNNGGFESLLSPPSLNPPNFIQSDDVPVWKTTASDRLIEIWASGFDSSSNGPVFSVPSADPFFLNGGKYFAELNATQVSTLFQEVTASKSGLISYSFWTRGRQATDTMGLRIDAQVGSKWVPIYFKQFSTAPGAWVNYQGENIAAVRAGTKLRFNYVSIAGSTTSIGNFLDNAAFGILDLDAAPLRPDTTLPGIPPEPGQPQGPGRPGVPPLVRVDPGDIMIDNIFNKTLAFHWAANNQTYLQMREAGSILQQQFSNNRIRFVPREDPNQAPDGKEIKSVVSTKGEVTPVEDSTRWNVWTSASGVFSDFSAVGAAASRDSEMGNFMVGGDFALNSPLRIGVFAAYQYLDQDFGGLGGGATNSTGFVFGGYLSFAPRDHGFYTDLAVGGATYSTDIERPVNFLGVNVATAHSNADTAGVFALLNSGYDFQLGNWTLGPVGSLLFSYAETDGYEERDPLRLNFNVERQQSASLYSTLGARLATTFPLGQTAVLVPEFRAVWNHDFNSWDRSVEGRIPFVPGRQFSFNEDVPAQDSIGLSAGLTFVHGSRFSAGVYYQANLYADSDSIQTTTVSLKWAF